MYDTVSLNNRGENNDMAKDKTEKKTCPQCKGSGDAHRLKANGKQYWFPCPVCNGGREEPNMKRWKQWKEDHK